MLLPLLCSFAHASPQVAIGDFDGDRLPDQATVDGRTLVVVYGSQSMPVEKPSGGIAIAVGDVNDDGYDELILLDLGGGEIRRGSPSGLGAPTRVKRGLLGMAQGWVVRTATGAQVAVDDLDAPTVVLAPVGVEATTPDDVWVDGRIVTGNYVDPGVAVLLGQTAAAPRAPDDVIVDGRIITAEVYVDPRDIDILLGGPRPVPLYPIEIRELQIKVAVPKEP